MYKGELKKGGLPFFRFPTTWFYVIDVIVKRFSALGRSIKCIFFQILVPFFILCTNVMESSNSKNELFLASFDPPTLFFKIRIFFIRNRVKNLYCSNTCAYWAKTWCQIFEILNSCTPLWRHRSLILSKMAQSRFLNESPMLLVW